MKLKLMAFLACAITVSYAPKSSANLWTIQRINNTVINHSPARNIIVGHVSFRFSPSFANIRGLPGMSVEQLKLKFALDECQRKFIGSRSAMILSQTPLVPGYPIAFSQIITAACRN